MQYSLVSGVRAQPLDQTWAVYSSISGDTLQLNDEAVAILEVLAAGPMDEGRVCKQLAADSNTDAAVVAEAIRHAWQQLLQAGLVRCLAVDAHNHE
jgi:PqqD family protein of HPr-rel-A system